MGVHMGHMASTNIVAHGTTCSIFPTFTLLGINNVVSFKIIRFSTSWLSLGFSHVARSRFADEVYARQLSVDFYARILRKSVVSQNKFFKVCLAAITVSHTPHTPAEIDSCVVWLV